MSSKKRKVCFVIMPFNDERKEVYTYGIKPACERAGFKPVRVDQLKGPFNINREIIEHLYKSDVIVAELTDRNPNVFYEMGVGHAIDNKTIMIVQDSDRLPFDIRNYRCIIYKQSVEGLKSLEEKIVEFLTSLDEWRLRSTNPVQDFKPHHAFIPKHVMDELQQRLQEKESLLKSAVPKKEFDRLDKELKQKQNEIDSLQKELQRLRSQASGKRAKHAPDLLLRSQVQETFGEDKVKKMLREKDFFDIRKHKEGKGIQHKYETIERQGQKLVIDHATGLTWQQSGSEKYMNFKKAEEYVQKLNKEKYGGYDDWRLPTLEEAMSLMEPEQKHGDLYIDPVFDKTQRYIWTADKESASRAWVVDFFLGYCGYVHVEYVTSFVRAVR